MTIGLCTISNKDASFDSVCETAATVGADGVEIWGGHLDAVDSPEVITDAAVDRSLSVLVYGSYLRVGTDSFDDELEAEIDAAAALGADLIRVWAGETGYADHEPADWEQAVSDLRRLARAATERGIAVTVERHKNSLTDERDGARRLVEAVDSPALGLNWQPLFGQPADEIVIDAEHLAPLSNNVHLQALPEPDAETRCALSDAYFDVEAIVDTFAASGFDGTFEVEFVTPDGSYRKSVRNDVEYLQSVIP